MKYTLTAEVKPSVTEKSVGHDDDQHESVLFGEDLGALTKIDDLEDGQPSGATENLISKTDIKDTSSVTAGPECEECIQKFPNVSRVIDEETGVAHIHIVLGPLEKSKYLATIVGLLDSTSEKDTVDITVCANMFGVCDTYSNRSLLSAIDRCKASVTTHAGALTTISDVAVWLSGDVLKYSKKMSFIMIRQPLTGFEGDIADYESKVARAKESWKEFSGYVAARNLFTKSELATMYDSRGMLFLSGKELEARVAGLKEVTD